MGRAHTGRLAAATLAALIAGGCATLPEGPVDAGEAPTRACHNLFERADAAARAADTVDARAEPIAEFPWLRVDRPLASFRDEVTSGPRFNAWLRHLAHLDAEARSHELANLPAERRDALAAQWEPAARARGLPPEPETALATCREILNDELRRDDDARERLRAAATVPDAYATWMRVVGLYPVARLFGRPQVVALHERLAEGLETGPDTDITRDYQVPTESLGDTAPTVAEAAATARTLRRDALGIPVPDERERATLFSAHAPLWQVETTSEADRPGALVLEDGGRPVVDTERPVEYRHFSWTRIDELVLPQLNYTVWFPERPRDGWIDPYAGHLDAVTWRVTLGPAGRVLAYDSIHACGCYYTLLPGPSWRAVADLPLREEPVFAPLPAPQPGPNEQIRVSLESGPHYILAVDTVERDDAPTDAPLAPLPSDHLRSLPLPNGGHASAYDSDGLIPASRRAERFFLWPFGVPSAGAMRQEGHHAIAFIGRRHFDDPRLLEGLLERDTPE